MKSKGNVKAQRKRRRKRTLPKKQNLPYELIDRNLTYYPTGYCNKYQGWLSVGLMDTHRCLEKQCPRFHEGVSE